MLNGGELIKLISFLKTGVPDHVAYEDSTSVVDYQIGFGCLPNHHCVLDYLSTKYPDPPYIDGMSNRFEKPNAGAFSYNRGREFIVSNNLTAGSEIFLNYGWCSRNDKAPSWARNIFVTEDYQQAARLIWRYQTKGEGLEFDSANNLVAPSFAENTVKELLPKTKDELHQIVSGITKLDFEEIVRSVARNSLHHRTPEWIKANGICMENLIAKPSTLPMAVSPFLLPLLI